MKNARWAWKNRRGGTIVIGIVAMTTVFIVVGVEMDYGRLFVARHKDQVIADACLWAAVQRMPNTTLANAEIARVNSQYNSIYNSTHTETTTYSGLSTAPTGVRCTVTENVPMFVPGLMGVSTRQTRATAASLLFNPTRVYTILPIGVQYDTNFGLPTGWLPTGSISSPLELDLKLGTGSGVKLVPGNFYPLALNGTGANVYSNNLTYGVSGTWSVGDQVTTETGNMVGPTTQGLDPRAAAASVSPYTSDTWTNFHLDNPRVVVLPLVDWLSATKGGQSTLTIKGFAAFYITHYGNGDVYGRFVRMVVKGTVVSGQTTFDAGLYSGRQTE
jgi:hypothetical protein